MHGVTLVEVDVGEVEVVLVVAHSLAFHGGVFVDEAAVEGVAVGVCQRVDGLVDDEAQSHEGVEGVDAQSHLFIVLASLADGTDVED